MTLDGAPYAPREPIDARRAGVAMIYQELSLAPHLTVMENIVLGVEPARVGARSEWRRDARRRRPRRSPQLGHAEIAPDALVGDLSPAAQQLVEDRARARGRLPRARARRADQQPRPRRRASGCSRCCAGCKAQGLAIVYISHFIEEVKAVSDRFVVLRDGRNAGGGVTAEPSADAIVQPDGRHGRSDELYPRSARDARATPLLELDGPASPARRRLTLHRGEILGIAGLLGAGRTRLLRDDLRPRGGAQRPHQGRRLLRGRPRRATRWRAGHGDAQRGPRGRGARARARASPTT